MTQNTSDTGNSTPAQKAMKQTSKIDESEMADSVDAPRRAQDVSEGDKPVGESDNNGSSPYEEPNHLVKRQRQGE